MRGIWIARQTTVLTPGATHRCVEGLVRDGAWFDCRWTGLARLLALKNDYRTASGGGTPGADAPHALKGRVTGMQLQALRLRSHDLWSVR